MAPVQPKFHSDIEGFFKWIEDNSLQGTVGKTDKPNTWFMPAQRLDIWLKDSTHTPDLLRAIYKEEKIPVEPQDIWRFCPKIFAILLKLGKGEFIPHFVHHASIWDKSLPFRSKPDDFPTDTSDEQFFTNFATCQWHFEPHTFGNSFDVSLEPERILPIKYKEFKGKGSSAEVYLIKVHQAYDQLSRKDDVRRVAQDGFTKSYVMKTYRGADAKENYETEVEAFRLLTLVQGKTVIRCYGGYIQNDRYHIIEEYADRGTLESFFQTTEPPWTAEDSTKFWTAMFELIKAVDAIHNVRQNDSKGPPLLNGWHQDIKPVNILVCSSASNSGSYDVEFRLADFGLSHFRKVAAGSNAPTDADMRGTREYGAPECYRLNDILFEQAEDVRQSVDIWSLGAIYSEAVVWAGLNKGALLRYRDYRRDETSGLRDFQDQGCFHDGENVLKTVAIMHKEVMKYRRSTDFISERVVDKMISEMLGDADVRPTTKQLRKRATDILNHATKAAKEKRSKSPAPSIGAADPKPDPLLPTRISSAGSPKFGPSLASVDAVPPLALTSRAQTIDSSNSVTESRVGTSGTDPPTVPPTRSSDSKVPTTSQELPSRARPHGGLRRGSSGYQQPPTGPFTPSKGTLDATAGAAGSVKAAQDQLQTQNSKPKKNAPLPIIAVADVKVYMYEKKLKKAGVKLPHESYLQELHYRDHVFLVDDSASMTPHWEAMKELFHLLTYVVKQYDKNGVDLYFTVSRHDHNSTKSSELKSHLPHRPSAAACDMGARLGQILHGYSDKLRNQRNMSPPRPTSNSIFFRKKKAPIDPERLPELNVYVLTDGLWQEESDVKGPIAALVDTMVECKYPRRQVGIQFIRFGDDPKAIEMLKWLDDGLKLPLDIVDTEPHDGNVLKMLVGAINKWFDGGKMLEVAQAYAQS